MESDRLDRLTEQQRICLRHVFAHLTSKEIAPLMGIEPNTVDQHIKAAMKVLDAPDRRTAARMLAEHENRTASRPLVYQSPDVASAPDPTTFVPSSESGRHSGFAAPAIREQQAAYMAASPVRIPTLPLPIGGARPDDLTPLRRVGWIFGIMLLIALTFGVFLAGLEALSRLGHAVN
jgi:DNA-binding CsgD family transcriptional regulator